MSDEDILGGFVLDSTALSQLAGANIFATTFAERAAVRGIVLVVPACALSESWQRAVRADPDRREVLRALLVSPMVVVDPLDVDAASASGDLLIGIDREPDVAAAQVVLCAQTREWPVLAADPDRLWALEPSLVVERLPGN